MCTAGCPNMVSVCGFIAHDEEDEIVDSSCSSSKTNEATTRNHADDAGMTYSLPTLLLAAAERGLFVIFRGPS